MAIPLPISRLSGSAKSNYEVKENAKSATATFVTVILVAAFLLPLVRR
jgi:hypothetical protein